MGKIKKRAFYYLSRSFKSHGSYGNSPIFLQRSQYITLDFDVLKKTKNGKCGLNSERLLTEPRRALQPRGTQ